MNYELAKSIFILIFFGALLAVSASWVVQGSAFLAKKFAVKSFVLGFLLLGIITTIPEMFVAFQAVRDGMPQLTVGNLLGGSILLLSFAMGIGAICLKRVILDHGMTVKDILFSSIVVAAPSVVLWDGQLTRIEGVLLIAIYVFHVLFINREHHVMTNIEHHAKHVKHVTHAIILFVLGIVGVAISSHFMVSTAESLTKVCNISPFIVGLFLLTLGTNLPELTLVVTAIRQKKKDLAFGDILGSAAVNTPILGVVCLIAPFSVSDTLRTQVTLGLLFIISLFFYLAASTKKDITRKEGIILLLVYVAFVAFELLRI